MTKAKLKEHVQALKESLTLRFAANRHLLADFYLEIQPDRDDSTPWGDHDQESVGKLFKAYCDPASVADSEKPELVEPPSLVPQKTVNLDKAEALKRQIHELTDEIFIKVSQGNQKITPQSQDQLRRVMDEYLKALQ